ncbi:hypothetical protein D3C80_1987600 [compost metagenome]
MAAAVIMAKLHRALEAVVEIAGALVVRRGHADHPAQLGDEGLIMGPLADRGLRPTANEIVCIHGLRASPANNPRLT